MSASEEQLEAHRAQEEARAREERERREAFVASLLLAYREAVDRACASWPADKPFDPFEAMRIVDEAAVLAVAERACRVHAADLLRIECDLNGVLTDFNGLSLAGRLTRAGHGAISAMRRLRARMRGKGGGG